RARASIAYFLILGLSVFSFLANLPHWHWQRFLPWGAVALLGALQVRTVPFFAIVAAPVLVWNLREVAAGEGAAGRPSRAGGVLAGARVLALLVCAWPGWLRAPPFGRRTLALQPPPSLAAGADATRRWHAEGKLSQGSRTLHLSNETASAFAWLCPEDAGTQD